MIFYCRCCLGVTKEIGKVPGFEIRWIEDLLYFWRGHGNAFTRYVDLKFWIADDWIFYCLCFRSCLAQLQQRPICNFVKWVNTYYNKFLCAHCLGLAQLNSLTIITIQVIFAFCMPHQDIDCKRENNVEKCMWNCLICLTG